MTSMQGFMDGSYDYRQMYSIKDLKGPLPEPRINPNTILGTLETIPECAVFKTIIESLPIAGLYNDPQGDFSIFVPIDVGDIDVRDSYKMRKLVLMHTLEHALPYLFLRSSGAMFLDTKLRGTRLLIENVESDVPVINRQSRVIGVKKAGNANIFIIDRVLGMNSFPLTP